ncbi:response regulator [Duganella fentianensis]|uniref:ANTAR domain-containing response regulator n=1 Tax=Duganella fentianensis TaxID=2692177 RepID=UPI0032B0F4B4
MNSHHHKATLLLVEDDRLVLSTTAAGLRHAGYQVDCAESAEQAEAWLATGARPDLAILDVRMQGQGGLALAERLSQLDHIPFLMLSAYGEAAMVEQATRSGALAYLVKPQDVQQLLPVIESALARASELDELRRSQRQLQTALDSERSVNVATGIVMMEYKLSRTAAFHLLRDAARRQRRKLTELADEVVNARNLLSLGADDLRTASK